MNSSGRAQAIRLLVDEPHYKAIGKVAANWAVLEAMISTALWRLAKVDDITGTCLTSQIPSMSLRIDALVSLARYRGVPKSLISKLTKLLKDGRGLQDQRNRTVHDPWHVNHDTGELSRLEITARRTAKLEYVPIKIEDIEGLVDRIYDYMERFDTVIREVFAAADKGDAA